MTGADDGYKWCSTKVGSDGVHVSGTWGRCDCKGSLDSPNEPNDTDPETSKCSEPKESFKHFR